MKKQTNKKRVVRGRSSEIGQGAYSSIHHWIRKNYGSASHCEATDCTKKSLRFQYALKRDCQYAKNRENYMQLCSSCHAKYDLTPQSIERRRKSHLGVERPFLWKPVVVKDGRRVRKFPSLTHASRELKAPYTSLFDAIHLRREYRGLTITYQHHS